MSKHPTQKFNFICFQFQNLVQLDYKETKLTIFSTYQHRQELGKGAFALIFIPENRQQHAAIGQPAHRK